MDNTSKFDAIRPYNDQEALDIFPKMAQNEQFVQMMEYIYPQMNLEQIKQLILSCISIEDFIHKVSYQGIKKIVADSCNGLTFSGFDSIDMKSAYLFISNHRDIVLDSTILNLIIHEHGMLITKSAIGDNLVPNKFLLDISKLNKNFIVKRDLSLRETLESSFVLSQYIHYSINQENTSVWLAQREGRTKDGHDATHSGVLKMLCMASTGDTIDHLKSLRIVPMSISYEYDPTDMLKVPQLLAVEKGIPYVKTKGEDLNSIITGINGYKGRVNISIGSVLDEQLEQLRPLDNTARILRALCQIIDQEIYRLYHLFPTNYIAYDMLHKSEKYKDKYTLEEKEQFAQHIKKRLQGMDSHAAKTYLLKMYATPVVNHPSFE